MSVGFNAVCLQVLQWPLSSAETGSRVTVPNTTRCWSLRSISDTDDVPAAVRLTRLTCTIGRLQINLWLRLCCHGERSKPRRPPMHSCSTGIRSLAAMGFWAV